MSLKNSIIEYIIDNNAYMVYPSEKNNDVQLFIMLSENPSYKKFIDMIINKYNGILEKCHIGNRKILLILKNIDILIFLYDVYKDKSIIQYGNDEYSLYHDYIKLYSNQYKYFNTTYFL